MDPRITELLQSQDASSVPETFSPAPKIPAVVNTPRPKVMTLPQASGHMDAASDEDFINQTLKNSGQDPKNFNPDKILNPGANADQTKASSFFSSLVDAVNPVNMVKGFAKGTAQFGANVSDSVKRGLGLREGAQPTVYTEGDNPMQRTYAKIAELGEPTLIGASIGSFAGPPGVAIGAIAGAAIGSFISDPDEGNLSTALQETKLKDYPVIGKILDYYAHKPGDTQLQKRFKNMYENAIIGVAGEAGLAGATSLAKSRGLKRVGQAMYEVYDDTRTVMSGKVRNIPESTPAQAAAAETSVAPIAEKQLQSIEAGYAKEGQEVAHSLVEDLTPKEAPVVVEGQAPGQQLDMFEALGELEDLRKAKLDTANLSRFEEKGQLSFTNMDEADIAGVQYNEQASAQFDAEIDKVLPEQFEHPIGEAPADNLPMVPKDLKVTLADEGVADRLETLADIRAKHYADKAEVTPIQPRAEVVEQAYKELQNPAERARVLDLKEVSNEMDMAKVQQLHVEAFMDYEQLMRKVQSGEATDLELAAFQEAEKNHFVISARYYQAGTDVSRTFGMRQMLRKYAQAGDPTAIKLIGNEGKVRAIKALIDNAGGREALQSEAALMQQVMEMAAFPKGSRESLAVASRLAPDNPGDLIEATSRIMQTQNTDYIMQASGEIAAKSRGRRFVDAANGYIFDNMLLHWGPAVKTMAELPVAVAYRTGENYALALISGVRGNGLEAAMRMDQANRYSMSLVKNFTNASRLAAREFGMNQVVNDGTSVMSSTMEVPSYLKTRAAEGLSQASPQSLVEKQAALTGMNSPSYQYTLGLGKKVLASIDAFSSHLGYNAYVESELVGMARRQGLSGKAVDEFVTANSGARVPREIHDAGMWEGAKLAYRADVETPILGSVDNWLHANPAAKQVLPMFRSFANGVDRTIEYFPGLNFILPSVRADKEKAIAKGLTGMGAMYLAMHLFEEDENGEAIVTHAEMPGVYHQQFLEEGPNKSQQGRMPLSYKDSSGKYVQLPVGGRLKSLLETASYLKMAIGYMGEDEAQASIRAFGLAATHMFPLDDQLKSLDTIYNAFSDIKQGAGVKAAFTNLGVGMVERTVPGYRLAKEAATQSDTVSLDTRAFGPSGLDYVKEVLQNRARALVPGLTKDLLPNVNILGEPVMKISGSVLTATNAKSSEVMSKLMNLAEYSAMHPNSAYTALVMQQPPKVVEDSGMQVELTTELYKKLQIMSGGIDPKSGKVLSGTGVTLREALDGAFKTRSKEYENIDKRNVTPQEFNTIVADVQKIVGDYKAYALTQIKKDTDFQRIVQQQLGAAKQQQMMGIPSPANLLLGQ